MNMLFKSTLLAPVVALGLAAAPAMAQETTNVDVTFLVAADIYEMSLEDNRGGFGRAASIVRAERAKGGNLVYVWAGDAISPSLYSGFDQGEHVINLINLEAPDFFVPGNHEFDFGKDLFLERMDTLSSEKLAANMRNGDGTMVDGFSDTKMLDYDGVKIGLVGLTSEDASSKSSPGDLSFTPALDTLMSSAADLREAGADLIVVVTHSDVAVDRTLLESGAADIILSGDDHDMIMFYDGEVAVAEPLGDGYNLVAVDVSINVRDDGERRRVKWYPQFRILDTLNVDIPDDYTAIVSVLQDQLSQELDVVIGTLEVPLDTRKAMVRTQETAFGNLVTDAMKNAVGADIAITNGGGIRSNREYEVGYNITRRDILSELPFGNSTLMLEVSGADVLAALENGLKSAPEATGRFPQVSGLQVVYDPEAEVGSRVVSVKVNGVDLDPAATYKLATNDYMARGGDGYSMLIDSPRLLDINSAKLMANDVMAYIRAQGTVTTTIEGRMKTGM